jgi:hypothetical protein
MSFLDTVANIATSALDQYGDMLFGGQLQKAKLVTCKSPEDTAEIETIEFFLNPETITVGKEVKLEHNEHPQNPDIVRWQMTKPTTLKLDTLWFDTYETRENVRDKYINKLEALLDFLPETHTIPCVYFVFGEFSQVAPADASVFRVENLNVKYTMFLPDGTPVRAQVTMKLVQAQKEQQEWEVQKESPDHAKLHTVRRGDTLQGISMKEYDDPAQWRRIADLNGIDNPMMLEPGRKLLVPPILK